jgi:hypothetical protein
MLTQEIKDLIEQSERYRKTLEEIFIICKCASNEKSIDKGYYIETLLGASIKAQQALEATNAHDYKSTRGILKDYV